MAYDSRSDRKVWGDFPWYGPRETYPTSVQRGAFDPVQSAPTKVKRFLKRKRSKENRRRTIPFTQMRGYGWGDNNYRNWD